MMTERKVVLSPVVDEDRYRISGGSPELLRVQNAGTLPNVWAYLVADGYTVKYDPCNKPPKHQSHLAGTSYLADCPKPGHSGHVQYREGT